MPKKIAIYNSKGGVGKTTLSITFGHVFAKNGYKVLLVDLDSQRNSSLIFGVDLQSKKTLYNLIRLDDDELLSIDKSNYIVNLRSEKGGRLDLMSNEKFAKINKIASEESHVFGYLDKFLKPFEEDYDIILFDCAPTELHIIDAVLCYVKNVIVPIEADFVSISGISIFFERLDYLRIDRNIVKAIIPNMMEHTSITKENLAFLKSNLGDVVTDPIPKRVAFKEVIQYKATIWEYQMDQTLKKALKSVVEKVVERIV